MRTKNIEQNDEAQIIATVAADRRRARAMTTREWLDWFQDELNPMLARHTPEEIAALNTALKTPGSEPQARLARDVRHEVPYYTAGAMTSWLYRRQRDGALAAQAAA